MNRQKIIQIAKDIMDIQQEITRFESKSGFDRGMAIELIRKHTKSDPVIAIYNSPLNPNYTTFADADNLALCNHLKQIKNFLDVKLLEEESQNE